MSAICILRLPPKTLVKNVGLPLRKHLIGVRNLNVDASERGNFSETVPEYPSPDYLDLDVCPEWHKGDRKIDDIRLKLLDSMTILPDFVSEKEEADLLSEIEPTLKRMRYEFDHWDNAIHGFRETERSDWDKFGSSLADRVKNAAFRDPAATLPHIHILDLDAKGYIKPHVDSIKFCGSTIAGICLLSPAVMRLRHSINTQLFADFLLARRSLYVMKDSARYDFTHEVLKNEESYFRQCPVARSRRISFILRNEPKAA